MSDDRISGAWKRGTRAERTMKTNASGGRREGGGRGRIEYDVGSVGTRKRVRSSGSGGSLPTRRTSFFRASASFSSISFLFAAFAASSMLKSVGRGEETRARVRRRVRDGRFELGSGARAGVHVRVYPSSTLP